MGQWIIVSNRLPFSYDAKKNKLKESSGGLVTAIKGIKTKQKIKWIGSLSEEIPKDLVKDFKEKSNITYSYPILPTALYKSYYNKFCNDFLWPIFHYETEIAKFSPKAWEDYKKVNKLFAELIAKEAKDDDLIWLHDFHLFLVPKYLKKLRPKLKIGFFLHIPFPSSEIYRSLPNRREILESLLCADLVGFHDFSYLRHFASAVYNILGIHSSLLSIESQNHVTKLGIFPVSIDTQDFINSANSEKTKKAIKKNHLDDKNLRVILGVDRLDYTKGLIYKLQAFEEFLKKNKWAHEKVQLIQVAVPSRTDVEDYKELRHQVESLIGAINGKYSTIDYTPIKYIFNSVTQAELMALYRSSEVLFVASKRDGMNLVCLEYICAQDPKTPGTVLLSEFTGAASTLSHATLINPMNTAQTAEKINDAFHTDQKERIENHQVMLSYLKNYTATVWAETFLQNLENSKIQDFNPCFDLTNSLYKKEIKEKIKNKKKIFMLDYDGTLAPIVTDPDKALPEKEMIELIKKIQTQSDNEVVIVSGRTQDFLSKQFKNIPCYLACEHGAVFYDYKTDRWRNLVSSNKNKWYKSALEIIEDYTRRTPNSFYEKKNYALTWHYRKSPNEFSEFQAKKLVVELESALTHLPVSVILGKKVVEIKSLEANKGYFAQWFMSRYALNNEIIFAMGDDRTDEDLFSALSDHDISIKVGDSKNTRAKYFLPDQLNVKDILKYIL